MNKKILFLILLTVILLLPFAYAEADNARLCGMVAKVRDISLLVGGSMTVVGWVVAGILYLTSAGGERMKTAKTALIAAVIGTVLVALSWSAGAIIIDTIGEGEVSGCE